MRVFGIVVAVLGILCLATPAAAAAGVAMAVGIFLILAGLTRIAWAFQAGSFGSGAMAVLAGGVTVVGGGAMLARPMLGAVSIALILAIYFLADGITEIVQAFSVKPEGWRYMAFDGAVTILLAWLIWSQWPLSGAWAIGVLTGVRLIFAGTGMLMFGSAVKEATSSSA